MILHLTATTHHISAGRIKDTITGTSRHIHCLQNMDMGTRHLAISYKKTCRCQCCKSATDNIRILIIDPLRLLGSGKSLIVSIGIINSLAVLFIFSAFRIAVIDWRLRLCNLFDFLLI